MTSTTQITGYPPHSLKVITDKAEEAKAAEELEYTREVRHEALHLAMDFHANVADSAHPGGIIATASTFESYLRGE